MGVGVFGFGRHVECWYRCRLWWVVTVCESSGSRMVDGGGKEARVWESCKCRCILCLLYLLLLSMIIP